MTPELPATQPSATGNQPAPRDRLTSSWPWLLSLFLAGFGAKVWLIARFGTPLPFWDHWEEALSTYMPYFNGQLNLGLLFRAHNETRPFFTRVYGLVVLLINGQWDAQLQMVLNAAVHVLTITWFGWLAARCLGKRSWPWLWLPLAAALALPFAWESTLAGLHSQFYFMLMFALPTLWLLSQYPPWSWRWWLGVVTGLCAIFNVASGFIAAAAVFCLIALKIFKRRETLKFHIPTLAACMLVILVGVLAKADVPHHRVLKAHSVMDFVVSLGKNLAWPWIVVWPYAVINFLPLLVLGWFYLRSSEESQPAEELTLVTGFWTLISAAATAFARGAGGAHPQWRYMDTTSFALICNTMAILLLLHRYRGRLWFGRYAATAGIVWALVNAAGLLLLTSRAWNYDIPERAFYHVQQLRGVRAYLATGDEEYLKAKQREQRALFYPEMLVPILNDPHIRSRLPACVREPLKVQPAQSTSTFVTNGWNLKKPDPPTEFSWGSWNAQGAAATGVFESQPIPPAKLPFLEFHVAGDLGKPGFSLELVDIASGRHTIVRPASAPAGTWRRCEVKAPSGEFKIVARDDSTTGWFAFRPPTEVGWMSWLSFRLLSWGGILFGSGVILYLAAVVAARRSAI